MRSALLLVLLLVVSSGLTVASHFVMSSPEAADAAEPLHGPHDYAQAYDQGCLLYASGRPEDALSVFRQVIDTAPAGELRDRARLHAADCMLEAGRSGNVMALEKAEKTYALLVAESVHSEHLLPAHWGLAEAMVLKGNSKKAREVLAAGAAASKSPQATSRLLLALGKLDLDAGEYDAAGDALLRVMRVTPCGRAADQAAVLRAHALARGSGLLSEGELRETFGYSPLAPR